MNAPGLVPSPPPWATPPAYDGIADPLASASTLAPRVDQLFLGLLLLSGMLILLLVGLNLGFLVRYRAGSRAPRPPLQFSPWKIEAGWITATTLVFLGPFFWGA